MADTNQTPNNNDWRQSYLEGYRKIQRRVRLVRIWGFILCLLLAVLALLHFFWGRWL